MVGSFVFVVLTLIFSPVAPGTECISADSSMFTSTGTIYSIPSQYTPPPGANYSCGVRAPGSAYISSSCWQDTGVVATGGAVNKDDPNDPVAIRFLIAGQWYPWGKLGSFTYAPCILKTCDASDPTCITGFSESDIFDGSVPTQCIPITPVGISDGQRLGGVKIDDSPNKVPCYLTCGWGLYGVIAIDANMLPGGDSNITPGYNSVDPNTADTSDPTHFRIFRVSPAYQTGEGEVQSSLVYILKSTQVCNPLTGSCEIDKNSDNQSIIQPGKVYLKIMDSYYDDNYGSYTVNISGGVYSPPVGFFAILYQTIENLMMSAATKMEGNILENLSFINTIQALITLYIVIFGLMFAMGLIKVAVGEMFMRVVKLGLVVTMITYGNTFFNEYLFRFFSDLGPYIGQTLMQNTLSAIDSGMQITGGGLSASGGINLPNPFSIVDSIFAFLFSAVLWRKIEAMIFTKFVIYIPLVITIILFLVTAILKAALLYLISTVVIAFLIAVAPIFIPMMLFQVTSKLFKDWLQQLMSNSMMFIIISAILVVVIVVAQGALSKIFYFSACQVPILEIEPILTLSWYKISDYGQASQALTFSNFLLVLLSMVCMDALMQQLPLLVDALSMNQGFSPMQDFFSGALKTLNGFQSSIAKTKLPFMKESIGHNLSSIKNSFNPVYLVGNTVKDTKAARKLATYYSTANKLANTSVGKIITGKSLFNMVSSHSDIADLNNFRGTRSAIGKGMMFGGQVAKKAAFTTAKAGVVMASGGLLGSTATTAAAIKGAHTLSKNTNLQGLKTAMSSAAGTVGRALGFKDSIPTGGAPGIPGTPGAPGGGTGSTGTPPSGKTPPATTPATPPAAPAAGGGAAASSTPVPPATPVTAAVARPTATSSGAGTRTVATASGAPVPGVAAATPVPVSAPAASTGGTVARPVAAPPPAPPAGDTSAGGGGAPGGAPVPSALTSDADSALSTDAIPRDITADTPIPPASASSGGGSSGAGRRGSAAGGTPKPPKLPVIEEEEEDDDEDEED